MPGDDCVTRYFYNAAGQLSGTMDALGQYTANTYDATGSRLSAEIAYADGTARGETNAGGESGENFASDFAVNEIAKGWYRANLLGTTLYVAGADGDVTAHARYDAWGRPMTETYIDANFSGLESADTISAAERHSDTGRNQSPCS
jgi:YD repeat-containing protein